MSDLTKFIRSDIPGGGAILDGIEGLEKSVGGAVAQPVVKDVGSVAIADIGTAFQSIANATLTKALGPGASVPEALVAEGLKDFEAWLTAKL